jgi:hypothetical protein
MMMMMMLLQLRRIITIRSHNNAIAADVCFRNISTTAAAAAASSTVQVPNKMKTKKDMPTVKKTKKDMPTVTVTATQTTTTSRKAAAAAKKEKQDSEYELRDFSPLGVAHMILFKVRQLPMSSMSTLCQVLDGNIVAPHKYPRYTNPLRVQKSIQTYKNEMYHPTTTITYTSG